MKILKSIKKAWWGFIQLRSTERMEEGDIIHLNHLTGRNTSVPCLDEMLWLPTTCWLYGNALSQIGECRTVSCVWTGKSTGKSGNTAVHKAEDFQHGRQSVVVTSVECLLQSSLEQHLAQSSIHHLHETTVVRWSHPGYSRSHCNSIPLYSPLTLCVCVCVRVM